MTSTKDGAPTLLAIETAGSACSAAVGRGRQVLAAERQAMRYGHVEALLPIVDRVVAASGVTRAALDGVAVGVGPGGFTGIRVGLGAAQGIALALKVRLIGVTSFAAVAVTLPSGAGSVLVALDSRREDFYVQLFDRASGLPLAEPAAVMPADLAEQVSEAADAGPLLIAGDIVEATAAALAGRFPIEIAGNSAPDARGVLMAALRQVEREPGGTLVRPLYLRPPDVTVPKNSPAVRAVPR